MSSRLFQIVKCDRISFPLRLNFQLYVYNHLVYPLMDIWVASASWLLGNDPINMGVQVSLQGPVFNSSGYIPRSAGPYGNSIFKILRKRHSVFHTGCTILLSQQQCTELQFLYILTNTCYFLLFR